MISASEFLKWLYVFNVQFGDVGPITIPVPMQQGGTGANLTPTNNSLFYSTASHGALLATANSSALVTDSSGNLSFSTALPAGMTIPNPTGNAQIANYQWVLSEFVTQLSPYAELSGATYTGNVFLAGNPTSSTEAANKAYVDLVAAGLPPAGTVYAASTTDLGYTYNNGTSGVGATLTAPGNGVFTVDGVSPPVGQDFLYKDDTLGGGTYNGIYQVTTSSAGSPAVLTRSTNYDTPTQINDTGIVPVANGTVNAGQGFFQTNTIVTIGTTPLSYIKFGNTGTVTSVATGAGLTGGPITGSGTISIAPIAGLNFLANSSGSSAVPSAYPFSSYATYLFANYINMPVSSVIVTGTSFTAATRDAYVINSGSLCTGTIPAGITPGNAFQVIGYQGGWQLNQSTAGMQIFWGARSTTLGTSGYIASSDVTDGVTLMCVATDTFIVIQPSGSLVVH